MSEQKLPTPDGVVSFLKGQHEEVKATMPGVLDAEGEARLRVFGEVRRMLALHETIEQAAVHPTARAESDDSKVVDSRLQEETEATEAIARLESTDIDSAEFEDGYRALMADVIEHAEREEHEEFVHIGTFTSDKLALVARGMVIAEQGPDAIGGLTFEEMLAHASTALHQS